MSKNRIIIKSFNHIDMLTIRSQYRHQQIVQRSPKKAGKPNKHKGSNLKDYAWIADLYLMEHHASLPEINMRLADQIVSLNGKLEFPKKFVIERFAGMRL